MRTKDIVIGFIVLVLVIAGVLLVKRRGEKLQVLPTPTPTIEQKISDRFNGLEIPDTDKIELNDVSGGNGFGIATADTVLADLPDPEGSFFYQVWVERNGALVSLGIMRVAKGGFIFEGKIEGKKVVVSREKVFDNKIETTILEGSF